ncbi:hypothetical protein IV102_37775 [bacterium]|nr:hypothetical protein [bacterium]
MGILVLIWIAQWLILSPHFSLPPMYDGAWNYSDLLGVLSGPGRLSDSVLSGHTTMGYVQILLLSQRWAPGNVALVGVTNYLLLAAATGAFWRIARQLLTGPRLRFEVAVTTALFGLSPLVLANLLHLNWDFGVMVFEVLFLGALLSDRLWLAGLFGLMMALSKENGAPLYAAAGVLYAVITQVQPRRRVALLWPCFVYAGAVYLAFRLQAARPNGYLELEIYAKNGWAFVYRVFHFDPFQPGIQSYLADIFVLNFAWILSLPLAGFVGLRILGKARAVPELDQPRARFLGLLLLVVVYLITRYCPFNNVRYLLTAVPLVILLQVYSLIRLIDNERVRRCILAVCLGLMVASNFRTLDPVSGAFFGTFPWGRHSCLRLASLLSPHLIGRDELVYNLEFLQLGHLQDQVFQDIGVRPDTLIFVSQGAEFWMPGWIGAGSQRTTPRQAGSFEFHYCIDPHGPVGTSPFYFLDFPNVPVHSELNVLKGRFGEPEVRLYERDGYTLRLYRWLGGAR